MRSIILFVASLIVCNAAPGFAAGDYRGDGRCPLPGDWSRYSEPYEPLDHQYDYPNFAKADWPGWSCSYRREDGVIVQYGDSRTPQEQWLSLWGTANHNGD